MKNTHLLCAMQAVLGSAELRRYLLAPPPFRRKRFPAVLMSGKGAMRRDAVRCDVEYGVTQRQGSEGNELRGRVEEAVSRSRTTPIAGPERTSVLDRLAFPTGLKCPRGQTSTRRSRTLARGSSAGLPANPPPTLTSSSTRRLSALAPMASPFSTAVDSTASLPSSSSWRLFKGCQGINPMTERVNAVGGRSAAQLSFLKGHCRERLLSDGDPDLEETAIM